MEDADSSRFVSTLDESSVRSRSHVRKMSADGSMDCDTMDQISVMSARTPSHVISSENNGGIEVLHYHQYGRHDSPSVTNTTQESAFVRENANSVYSVPFSNPVTETITDASSSSVVSSSSPSSSSTPDYIHVTLIDAIPCNLRDDSKFLASSIELDLSRSALRLFLQCYGFLMYDKQAKLQTLRNNVNPEVREVADILDECKTLADFKVCVQAHLKYIQDMLADPAANGTLVDEHETNPQKRQEQYNSSMHILNTARQALEHVFAFIRNSDHLRRSLNVNEYCRQNILRDAAGQRRNAQAVYDAWHDSADCDLNRCLSIIFRDAIVTTGLQTQCTLLFIIRSSLLLTYTISNFLYRRDSATLPPPRIRIVLPDRSSSSAAESSLSDTIADYWSNYDELTIEKVIATMMTAMTRMFVSQYIDTPKNVSSVGHSAVPLDRIQTILARRLSQATERERNSQTLPWLRVMRSGKHHGNVGTPSVNTIYGTAARRLYVNMNSVLSMFDELSLNVNFVKPNDEGYYGDESIADEECTIGIGGGNGSEGSSATLQAPRMVIMADQRLRQSWQQYERDVDLCVSIIMECINDRAAASTVNSNSTVATAANEPQSTGSISTIEQFVMTRNGGFRAHDEDLNTVTRTQQRRPTGAFEGNSSESRGEEERRDDCGRETSLTAAQLDEVNLLSSDVGMSLLFTILSLIRYDVAPKRYDSLSEQQFEAKASSTSSSYDGLSRVERSFFDDERYESHRVMLIQAMSHLYQMKMTRTQIRELFDYLLRTWRLHVGVISIEQFSEILMTLYKLFPSAWTENVIPTAVSETFEMR